MSVMFFVSIACFPIIGMISDFHGYRITFLQIAGALAILAYSLFLSMKATLIPLIVLGLSYSFFGSIVWPCAAYLVPE